MHVPLYFAMPGGPTGPVTQLTSLLQVAPTLRAMVGEPGIGPGPGPYLCVGQRPCRDALAPMALERRAVHLHGLVQGSRQLLRDLTLQRDTAYALDMDPPSARRWSRSLPVSGTRSPCGKSWGCRRRRATTGPGRA
jgi:hypothetical protein